MENSIKNKVIVITGGSGVICSELARGLDKLGAKIAILDLNKEKAIKFAKSLKRAKGYECNVLDSESLKKVHKQINKDFGKVDILINGAGGNNPKATTDNEYQEIKQNKTLKDFFKLDKEGIEFVFNLNIIGTVLPSQEFSKDMLNRKGCSILNISSMNAFTPLTKIPAYSAAKAGVSNFTKWLAVHFSHVGIRVNAIAPGFFVTNQNKTLLFNNDGTLTSRSKKIINATPMGRFGEVKELVGATIFLLDSKSSSFITGVVLPIDGGFSSYSGV